MYFDGSRSYGHSGARILIVSPHGERLRYVLSFDFPTTTNISRHASLSASNTSRSMATQLVVQQYNKKYQCIKESMAKYLLEVRKFEKHFKNFEMKYIPCRDNVT